MEKIPGLDTFEVELDFTDVEKTEAILIEKMHEVAMSSSPEIAIIGRILKELAPGFVRAIANEAKRETKPAQCVFSLTRAVSSLVAMFALGICDEGKELEAAKNLGELFTLDFVQNAAGRAIVATMKGGLDIGAMLSEAVKGSKKNGNGSEEIGFLAGPKPAVTDEEWPAIH